MKAGFDDLGSLLLKNIERPVQAFSVTWEGADWPWPDEATPAEAGAPATSLAAPLALPDKPSIAVLPFDNMSRDPEQEHFADGVVEAITAALSRIRAFFVIARNSAFAYKGRPTNVREIGRELGVAYVLEGSVQRVGARVRITAQLIETAGGVHLWADGTTARSTTSSTCRTASPRRSPAHCSPRSGWPRSSARGASDRRNSAPTTMRCAPCGMPGRSRQDAGERVRSSCSARHWRSTRTIRWRWR